MKLGIPNLSLVVLVGASGSGKSTFARKHFRATEILSSDAYRGYVADDENDQSATADAFAALHYMAHTRLRRGRFTVVDATNVQKDARAPLIEIAREHHCLPIAIVLDVPEALCRERNATRTDRDFGPHVIRNHVSHLRRSLRHLKDEGFRHVFVLSSPEEIESVEIERQLLWNDKKSDHGPFDIIGDIHGCYDELTELIDELGYVRSGTVDAPVVSHPEGRRVVFLGDLVDRGPKIVEVLTLAMSMVASGSALCVPGNHEAKLLRKLGGRDVKMTHGLAETVAQLDRTTDEFRGRVREFIDKMVSHYVFDDGKLVVAHAGLKEELQGRGSGHVRSFCLFGETTGETDDYGLPIRYDWARDYRGKAMVVYGHTPVPAAEWVNNTICVDTGCVFGGALTALRYPERQVVSIEAAQMYYEPARPLVVPPVARDAGVLDREDVAGKRYIETRYHPGITLREENTAAALETMSRFAVDPRWLVYLPPTMSPAETSKDPAYLEHPREALAYFAAQRVKTVVCEEKHMGSRAVIVVCRDAAAAAKRFAIGRRADSTPTLSPSESIDGDAIGVVYTRTGRPFFGEPSLEATLLERLSSAVGRAGLWDELATDWICIDAEVLPWSAKAQQLLREQYGAVGAAGEATLSAIEAALAHCGAAEAPALRARQATRLEAMRAFREAYRGYSWDVASIDDYRMAPFHLLASEGKVHVDRDHVWHMTTLGRIADAESIVRRTPHLTVDLGDATAIEGAVRFWDELTARGAEGMVVKPLGWIERGPKGLVQPAIKCRGREYLRIVYGPEYLAPQNLNRLRARSLSTKRSLALREYALGLEALHRFVDREPLHRIHECVYGVLALESVPVDPRL